MLTNSNLFVTNADYGVGILVTIVATLGILFNGFGFLIVKNNQVLASSFGQLCINHCIANFGICSIFLFWVAPMTLTQSEDQSTSLFGKIVGQLGRYFWCVILYSHVAVSIDRLVTIRCPLQAKNLFYKRRSKIFSLSPWIISFIHAIPNFWYDSCYMVYHPDSWKWLYPKDTQCGRVLPVFNMYKNFLLIGIMGVLDLATLYFLHKHHKYTRRMTTTSKSSADPDHEDRCRRREVRFFVQVVIQGGIFFFEQLNFHMFSRLKHDQWYLFIFTTLTWLMCHTLDGLVLCIFQLNGFETQRKISVSSEKVSASPA